MYNSSTSCPLPYSHPSNVIYNVQLLTDNLDTSNPRVGIAVGDSLWADGYHFITFVVIEYTKA